VETERKKILEDIKRTQEQQQAAQPPEQGVPAQGGGELQPATPADADVELGAEPEMGQEDGIEPEEIDDVDAILNSLGEDISEDDSFSDELEEILVKNRGGRPREGLKFGTDKHPLGRDPLGHKENKKTYKRSTLSTETKNFLDGLEHKKTSKYRQMISEQLDDTEN